MYNKNQLSLIWLSGIEKIPYKKKYSLIKLVDEPYMLWDNLTSLKSVIESAFDCNTYNILKIYKDDKFLDNLIKDIEDSDIKTVFLCEDNYPKLLKEIYDPPIMLYALGNLDLLNTRCISIVGTRRPTRYGVDMTVNFARDLAVNRLTIVSGLARGIDSAAHKAALDNDCNTIAVLGSGIDVIYPAENYYLYEKIAKYGLIVSEYKPKTPPNAYHFPERNRIISGLSEGLLVTEAGEKSGTMITLELALEQGRNLYIIPANINSKASCGSNLKLKQCQGALVTEANDILKDYNIVSENKDKLCGIQLDYIEQIVLTALESGELHFEELLTITNIKVSELNSLLTRMEILGIIRKCAQNIYTI